jgi:hypothetical protein
MAEYTGEVIYEKPQGRAKPVVNPALVNALVPPAVAPARSAPILSPQDQRQFDLSEANRRANEKTKIAEENRAAARKLEEEKLKEDNKTRIALMSGT